VIDRNSEKNRKTGKDLLKKTESFVIQLNIFTILYLKTKIP
jgi:hypothetical protein